MKYSPAFLLSAIFILYNATAVFAQTTASLDGKRFSITLEITGAKRPGINWIKDELNFEKNRMVSKFMSGREHFRPFKCTFEVDATDTGKIHFKGYGKNDGQSNIKWDGTIAGDSIEGTAVWTNANGQQTHRFSGKVK